MSAPSEITIEHSASAFNGESTWLFSRNIDLSVFLGSAIVISSSFSRRLAARNSQ